MKSGTESKQEIIRNILKKSKNKLKTAKLEIINKRYDDSISRSYYSVYHSITAVLFSKDLHYSSHSQTIGAFNKEFIKTNLFPQEITKIVSRLFHERQISDYDINLSFNKKTALKSYNDAKMIFMICNDYLSEQINIFVSSK